MKISSLRSGILLAGLLGLLVSIFAAAEFYQASLRSVCSFNSFFSCGVVDQSGLTTTLGVQDYLWGIGGFLLILIVAGIAERRASDPRPTYLLLGVTTLGVVLALYFLYIELALIHALCLVCVAAYIFGGITWIGTIVLVRQVRSAERGARKTQDPSESA